MTDSSKQILLHPGADFPETKSGQGIQFDFISSGCKISAFYYHREKYQGRLFVGFNGAVERKKGKDPRMVFQRRTWADSIEASSLFISDPTLHKDNNIQIGWGQGSAFSDPLTTMAQCVDYVRERLGGIGNESILFFGSSAGGFQAIQAHSRFPGSRFVVNNAQLDWSKYYQRYVAEILKYSHHDSSLETLLELDPSSVNVLERFTRLNLPFRGEYWINATSKIDFAAQLPVVNTFVKKLANNKTNPPFDFSIHYYIDQKKGHMPLAKDKTLSIVNEALSGLPKGIQ